LKDAQFVIQQVELYAKIDWQLNLRTMSKAEKAYKTISAFLFDLINTCMSVVKIIAMSRKVKPFPMPVGDACIVLGNGPSLRKSLEKNPLHFEGKSLLCVNSFCFSPEYERLQPSYCIMLDPGIWLSDGEFVRTLADTMKNKTKWPIIVFLPRAASRSALIRSMESNSNIRIHYFNYVVYRGFKRLGHFFYRKNLAMPQSQNVLVAALAMAVNLRYRRIEMFGADHDWHKNLHVNEDNIVCLRQVHFYEHEEKISFLPFYKGLHTRETFRMDEAFHAWALVFLGYRRLNDYARSRGSKILNGSEHSFVDAFERFRI